MELSSLLKRANELKQHALVVYFAARDPATPWPLRILALFVAAYAFSPIDLIPDFIPVLGYLDDLVIIPLGLALVLRFLPPEVRRAARKRAPSTVEKPVSRAMAAFFVAVWVVLAGALVLWIGQASA